MSGKNINFDDKKSRKAAFTKTKEYIVLTTLMLVSKTEPYGRKNFLKYFIGYNDNDNIRPLCIRLPQMTGNARKFDENATMSFIVKKNILKYGSN